MRNLKRIKKDELLDEVIGVASNGGRFIVMTCVDLGDSFEINYFFSMPPQYEMHVYRLIIGEYEELPSISDIYLCAILNENEFQEFYGVKIKNLAVDYKGHLFLANDSPVTPMRKPKKEEA